jgi:hypothetical protein
MLSESLYKEQLQFIFPLFCQHHIASSEFLPFHEKNTSPLLSLVPVTHRASRSLANPLGLSAASLFFLKVLLSDHQIDFQVMFFFLFY